MEDLLMVLLFFTLHNNVKILKNFSLMHFFIARCDVSFRRFWNVKLFVFVVVAVTRVSCNLIIKFTNEMIIYWINSWIKSTNYEFFSSKCHKNCLSVVEKFLHSLSTHSSTMTFKHVLNFCIFVNDSDTIWNFQMCDFLIVFKRLFVIHF